MDDLPAQMPIAEQIDQYGSSANGRRVSLPPHSPMSILTRDYEISDILWKSEMEARVARRSDARKSRLSRLVLALAPPLVTSARGSHQGGPRGFIIHPKPAAYLRDIQSHGTEQ